MDKVEKTAAADEFFLKMEKQAQTGEVMVKVIVVLSYVCMFADFVPSIVEGIFSVWGYIISILWAICYYGLYLGRVWAKWLYIISSAVVVLFLIIPLLHLAGMGGTLGIFFWYPWTWISVVTAVFRIAACVLLLRSKSVKQFIYS